MLLDDWENYLNGLCVLHKTVLHTVGGRRAFIPFGTDETPVNNSKLSSPYIRHSYFNGAGQQESLWVFNSEILFLVNVPTSTGNMEEKVKEARREAFSLLQDFEARIRYDYENGDICELLSDMGEAVIEPIGPEDQTAYGWSYTLRITGEKPDHDPEKWNEPV